MKVTVQQVERYNDSYILAYGEDAELPFVPHDTVLVQGEVYFLAVIRALLPGKMVLDIDEEFADKLRGDLDVQLAFSPLISIQGAAEVIKELGVFPTFYHEHITNLDVQDGNLLLTIELPQPDPKHKLQFTFFDLKEIELDRDGDQHIIQQLDFRYDGGDMIVDIESISGINGHFSCRSIEVAISSLH